MQENLLYKALADSTRRLILDELRERRGQTIYELTSRLVMKHKVSMSRQAITKHISILEKAGIVCSSRKGKHRVIVFNGVPLKTLLERWVE